MVFDYCVDSLFVLLLGFLELNSMGSSQFLNCDLVFLFGCLEQSQDAGEIVELGWWVGLRGT